MAHASVPNGGLQVSQGKVLHEKVYKSEKTRDITALLVGTRTGRRKENVRCPTCDTINHNVQRTVHACKRCGQQFQAPF